MPKLFLCCFLGNNNSAGNHGGNNIMSFRLCQPNNNDELNRTNNTRNNLYHFGRNPRQVTVHPHTQTANFSMNRFKDLHTNA
jgi:hypothetical protein